MKLRLKSNRRIETIPFHRHKDSDLHINIHFLNYFLKVGLWLVYEIQWLLNYSQTFDGKSRKRGGKSELFFFQKLCLCNGNKNTN